MARTNFDLLLEMAGIMGGIIFLLQVFVPIFKELYTQLGIITFVVIYYFFNWGTKRARI